MRKEGSRLVEEEIERVQKEVAEQLRKNSNIIDGSQYRIKIKWKVPHKDDTTNGGYTKDMLHTFLTKYGNIVALVLSTKKKGSALVEFETKNAAVSLLKIGLAIFFIYLFSRKWQSIWKKEFLQILCDWNG